MPTPPLWLDDDAPALVAGLARIREEFRVPARHGPAALEEADAAARRVLSSLDDGGRRDARDIEMVTIDPPGSRDLDQALHIEPRGKGWRIHYAIADVPAFVDGGGALDAEVTERGVTFYLPDGRSPLHPPVLGEDAASLLPGQDRAAVLWTIDLDADGEVVDSDLERAVVRSRAQLTYAEVQTEVDSDRAHGTVAHLARVGELRQAIEAERDGVSLDLPTQHVVLRDGRYHLEHEKVVAAMGWNAHISLLTGMVAARAMLDAGVGLLRTLPPPDESVVKRVRRQAKAFGIEWPDGATYASVVRQLDGSDPEEAALLELAARGLRGAGYLPLLPGTAAPEDPALLEHAAVAAPYAHVTAPLRRLCDRAAIEALLAIYAGKDVPQPTLDALPALPEVMASTTASEGGASSAAVNLVEALLLEPRVGEVFDAFTVSVQKERSSIVIPDLAVEAAVNGVELPLAEPVQVRLDAVDVLARRVVFVPA